MSGWQYQPFLIGPMVHDFGNAKGRPRGVFGSRLHNALGIGANFDRERLLKSDVKCRFAIDMASLKSN